MIFKIVTIAGLAMAPCALALPMIEIGPKAISGTEGENVELEVSSSEITTSELQVKIGLWPQGQHTATEGSDYILPESVTINAGQQKAKFTIKLIDDNVPESQEQFYVTVLPSADYIASQAWSGVAINDNAESSTVGFNVTNGRTREGNTTPLRLTIERTGSVHNDLNVSYIITDSRSVPHRDPHSGWAVNGSDIKLLPGVITITAGKKTADIEIWALADSVYDEGDERLSIRLTIPNINTSSGLYKVDSERKTANVVIEDADGDVPSGRPSVSITSPEERATEEPLKSVQFIITRSGPSDIEIHIPVKTSGTAHPSHYELANSVTIPAGESTATLELTPINDDLGACVEGGIQFQKTVRVSLQPGTGYVLAQSNIGAAVIHDSEDFICITSPLCVTPNPAHPGTTVHFHISFIDPNQGDHNDALYFKWDFGDGEVYEIGQTTVPGFTMKRYIPSNPKVGRHLIGYNVSGTRVFENEGEYDVVFTTYYALPLGNGKPVGDRLLAPPLHRKVKLVISNNEEPKNHDCSGFTSVAFPGTAPELNRNYGNSLLPQTVYRDGEPFVLFKKPAKGTLIIRDLSGRTVQSITYTNESRIWKPVLNTCSGIYIFEIRILGEKPWNTPVLIYK